MGDGAQDSIRALFSLAHQKESYTKTKNISNGWLREQYQEYVHNGRLKYSYSQLFISKLANYER